jgi:hypothetical protein
VFTPTSTINFTFKSKKNDVQVVAKFVNWRSSGTGVNVVAEREVH